LRLIFEQEKSLLIDRRMNSGYVLVVGDGSKPDLRLGQDHNAW
jgi:hypothetical protein